MERTSNIRVCLAVICAGSTAVLLMLLEMEVRQYPHHSFQWPLPDYTVRQMTNTAILYAVFGFPVAWAASLVVGIPVWKIAERRGPLTFGRGVKWGAATGALISVFFTYCGFLYGLRNYFDDQYGGSFSTGEGLIYENGMWTLLGWKYQGVRLIRFALVGALSGLVAIFVGRKSKSAQ